MRAVGITAPGGYEVLSVIDRPVREPGPGEVRIAVRAAAVNPTDSGLRARGGGELPAPWTPGMDAAGTIESLGAGVERLQVGEQVMAAVTPRRPEGGAQAELLLAPAASVVRIPDGATLEQAATLPMNGLTALLGLDLLGLESGQTLAVSGGAGLLASYVIPLAKQQGLRVIADAKPEDRVAFVSKLSRYTAVKESHAERVKSEVRIIWGDYFTPDHLKQHPEVHELCWKIMKAASKTRQGTNVADAQELLKHVQEFAELFWLTKGAKTHRIPSTQKSGGELVVQVPP